MADVTFTPDEIRAVFRLDSADARTHARCGPKSPCRVNALAKVDEDLDAWLSARTDRIEHESAPRRR